MMADNWELDNPRESQPQSVELVRIGRHSVFRLLICGARYSFSPAASCSEVLVGSLLLAAGIGGNPDYVDGRDQPRV